MLIKYLTVKSCITGFNGLLFVKPILKGINHIKKIKKITTTFETSD